MHDLKLLENLIKVEHQLKAQIQAINSNEIYDREKQKEQSEIILDSLLDGERKRQSNILLNLMTQADTLKIDIKDFKDGIVQTIALLQQTIDNFKNTDVRKLTDKLEIQQKKDKKLYDIEQIRKQHAIIERMNKPDIVDLIMKLPNNKNSRTRLNAMGKPDAVNTYKVLVPFPAYDPLIGAGVDFSMKNHNSKVKNRLMLLQGEKLAGNQSKRLNDEIRRLKNNGDPMI
jgi:hypothetical protein